VEHLPPAADDTRPGGAGVRDAVRRIGVVRAGSLVVIGLRVSSLALNFVLLFVLARVMGLFQFGVASTALALLNVLVIPAALGCDTAAIRYIALHRAQAAQLGAVTAWLARRVIAASAAVAALDLAAAGVELHMGHHTLAVAIALLAPCLPTYALMRFDEGWLRGSGSIVRAQLCSNLVLPGAMIAAVLVVWVATGGRLTAGAVLLLRAAVGLGAFAVTAWFVRGALRRIGAGAESSSAGRIPADARRVVLGLAGAAFVAMAATQVDILAVSAIAGARTGGVYSAAARVALAMNLAVVSVNFGLAPRAARLAGDRDRLQTLVGQAATFSAAIMTLGCLALMVAAPVVMAAFGPAFAGGATPLRILLAGQIVNGICGPVGTVLNMSGRQHYTLWTQAGALALQLTLLVTLIPAVGITGAAVATATANAAWNVGLAVVVRRELGVWALPLTGRARRAA
jgi:O-antigen/teichoic acid export membrane protein